jgi:hypothetical protein
LLFQMYVLCDSSHRLHIALGYLVNNLLQTLRFDPPRARLNLFVDESR